MQVKPLLNVAILGLQPGSPDLIYKSYVLADPPKVFCEDAYSKLGERNVSILCIVTSRPRTTSVRWFQDTAGKPFDVLSSTAFSASNQVFYNFTKFIINK